MKRTQSDYNPGPGFPMGLWPLQPSKDVHLEGSYFLNLHLALTDTDRFCFSFQPAAVMVIVNNKDFSPVGDANCEWNEGIPECPGHGAVLPAGLEGQKDKARECRGPTNSSWRQQSAINGTPTL